MVDPITKPTRNSTAPILKWLAGIVAGVVVAMTIFVLVGTARAVVDHGMRIVVLETSKGYESKKLDELIAAVKALDDKLDERLPARRR